jgi:hypothetical protein
LTAIRFGGNADHLYLRLDPDTASRDRQPNLRMDMTFQGPRETVRLTFSLEHSGPEHFTWHQATGPDSWEDMGVHRSISRKKIMELAIPWKDLRLEPDEEVRLWIVVTEHGLEVARYPYQRPAVLCRPGPVFEAGLWRV